ncbi:hypothetical protein CQ020_16310 [Arthrobacter sp. MYb23]|uniref:hypothetical protein n=1 Tax=unclassified Arthrobacter TaxID=235627 RepID=UPI000CFDA36E|nr:MULTISPECIES: hypothetical protein [unclassified Arthrobacter]PRB40525.1 hypothetical protein CQ038_16350 [Arthrobacter sp. MYb51]PRB94076.1 hypothetical protein CQ020_16310 [Arthrobacter sp. MYb23]
MLRSRPIHYTSRPEEWSALLQALGLVRTVDDGDWREFDAGSGRLALAAVQHGHPLDGSTVFGVEVGNLEEFARRTEEAGTEAELHEGPDGITVRISADDGFEFFAFPAERAADGTWATSGNAHPALTVVATWISPLVGLAANALSNIGARPRNEDDESATFTTKNGGILRVIHGADGANGDLAFEYDDGLEPLLERLKEAKIEARISENVLYIANPDASGGAAPASILVESPPADRTPAPQASQYS